MPRDSSSPITKTLLFIVLLTSSLAHITGDMYIPSLPAIKSAFHTDATTVQLTLTAFMIGFSSAHLFYGPFSDRFGRRPPLLGGVALGLAGSLICLFSPSIYVLILGRFVQGLGVAVCNSVGRSLIRDLVSGHQMARLGSHLGMIMVFITATAPTIGGYLQQYFNWNGVFLFLFLYGCFVLFMLWKKLPETNLTLNPDATKPKVVVRNYYLLLTSRSFLGYTLCVCCAYAGIIAYVTAAPFLLQTGVGLTPVQFGWLAFVVGGAIFTSFFINSHFVMTHGFDKMLIFGNSLMLLAGILMLFLWWLGYFNVFVIMLPVAIFCMGAGLTLSNAFPGAVLPFPKMAGSAAAVYGFLQILAGAFSSALMSVLPETDQVALGIFLGCLGLISLLSVIFLAKTK